MAWPAPAAGEPAPAAGEPVSPQTCSTAAVAKTSPWCWSSSRPETAAPATASASTSSSRQRAIEGSRSVLGGSGDSRATVSVDGTGGGGAIRWNLIHARSRTQARDTAAVAAEGTRARYCWLLLLGLAIGWFEAAVVVYLRALYYPDGFRFPVRIVWDAVVRVEIVREAASLLLLAAAARLAGRAFLERF